MATGSPPRVGRGRPPGRSREPLRPRLTMLRAGTRRYSALDVANELRLIATFVAIRNAHRGVPACRGGFSGFLTMSPSCRCDSGETAWAKADLRTGETDELARQSLFSKVRHTTI